MNKTLTSAEIDSMAAEIGQSLKDADFDAAFKVLDQLVPPGRRDDLEGLRQRYFHLLQFLLRDTAMPHLQGDLDDLTLRLGNLTDTAAQERKADVEPDNPFYIQIKYQTLRPEETLETLLADYQAELGKVNSDPGALTDTRRRARLERLAESIFGILWTDGIFSSDTAALMLVTATDPDIPVYDRQMWIAAVGLGYLHSPNERRYQFLHDLSAIPEAAVAAVAWAWMALGINSNPPADILIDDYDTLLDANTVILRQMAAPRANNSIPSDIGEVGQRFARNIQESDDIEEASAKAMADLPAGAFDKMKDFNERIARGEDVFFNTFGKMRAFDFFRRPANWFLPFHASHSALAEVVDGEGAAMADLLEKMHPVGHGDRFALLLSVAQAPAQIRSALLENMASSAMQVLDNPEMAEAAMISGNPDFRQGLVGAVRMAYRFFRTSNLGAKLGGDDPFRFFEGERRRGWPMDYLTNYNGYRPEAFRDFVGALTAAGQPDTALRFANWGADTFPIDLNPIAAAFEEEGNSTRAFEIYHESWTAGRNDANAAEGLLRNMNVPVARNLFSDEDIAFLDENLSDEDSTFLWLKAFANLIAGKREVGEDTLANLEYILPEPNPGENLRFAVGYVLAGKPDRALSHLGKSPESNRTLALKAAVLWRQALRSQAIDTLSGHRLSLALKESLEEAFVTAKLPLPLLKSVIYPLLRRRYLGQI